VSRAVASVTQTKARSLPLAVLIQRTFPYAQLQTAIDHPAALQVARAVVSSAAEKPIAVRASRISP
ncbi:MAG TPA: hypothetical protein VI260_10915, partial [Blastocatellia bacterium]